MTTHEKQRSRQWTQFSLRTVFVVFAVAGGFLAGWVCGRVEEASRAAFEASERGRLFYEKHELQEKIDILAEQLESCRASDELD